MIYGRVIYLKKKKKTENISWFSFNIPVIFYEEIVDILTDIFINISFLKKSTCIYK